MKFANFATAFIVPAHPLNNCGKGSLKMKTTDPSNAYCSTRQQSSVPCNILLSLGLIGARTL